MGSPINISNPTLQNWTVHYRLGAPGSPELRNLMQFPVPSGGQFEIGHGWDAIQKAQFIRHLEVNYGARDAAEVHGQMRGFSGLLYRDIGQITTTEIEQAHESETDTRQDRSVTQAVRSALAFDNASRRDTKARPGARVTEIEVTQELPRGQRRRGNEVAFSMTVDPEGRTDVALPVN